MVTIFQDLITPDESFWDLLSRMIWTFVSDGIEKSLQCRVKYYACILLREIIKLVLSLLVNYHGHLQIVKDHK